MRINAITVLAAAAGGLALFSLTKRNRASSKRKTPTGFASPQGCYQVPLRSEDLEELRAEGRAQAQIARSGTVEDRILQATAAGMKRLCPQFPVPSALQQLANFEQANGPAWAAAWDAMASGVASVLMPAPT